MFIQRLLTEKVKRLAQHFKVVSIVGARQECKGQLTKHDTRGLKAFYDTYPQQHIMPGMIIYAGNECYQLDDNIIAVPWNAMFANNAVL